MKLNLNTKHLKIIWDLSFFEEILGNKVDLELKDTVKEQLKDKILSHVINV